MDIRLIEDLSKDERESQWAGAYAPPFFITGAYNMLIDIKNIKPAFKTQAVSVKEIQADAELLIRELSGADQAELMALMQTKKPDDMEIAAVLFAKTIVNEAGEKMLANRDEARAFISSIPARTFNRLNKAIWELNNGEAEKKA